MNKQLLLAVAGIVLLTVTGVLLSTSSVAQNDADVLAAYKQWKHTFGVKAAASPEEELYRQSVFTENYFMIQEHNAKADETYTMGLNAFSNLTEEEFQTIYLINMIPTEMPSTVYAPKSDSPIASSLNWATQNVLPPVKNQGQCGSCWAFSTAALLESTNVIFNNVDVVSFSEQQLVDCCGANGYGCEGCGGAWPTQALNYTQHAGIVTEASYPYTAVDGACQGNLTAAFTPSAQASVANNSAAFIAALNVQPISICVDASGWSYYSKGVFSNCSSKPRKADHAVLLVGYDTDGNWIVRNSWGSSWGNAGYITLKSGNTCGVFNYGVVASA